MCYNIPQYRAVSSIGPCPPQAGRPAGLPPPAGGGSTGPSGPLRRLRRRPRPALWVAVALALLPLALVTVGEVWAPLGFFRLMGVSYMTFRAVEVLLNCYDGRLKSLHFGDLC